MVNPRISVTDLGPLQEGAFELAPLTVFIGPNNAGKSVAATLAYASMLSAGPASLYGYVGRSSPDPQPFRLVLPVRTLEAETVNDLAEDIRLLASRLTRPQSGRAAGVPGRLADGDAEFLDAAVTVTPEPTPTRLLAVNV